MFLLNQQIQFSTSKKWLGILLLIGLLLQAHTSLFSPSVSIPKQVQTAFEETLQYYPELGGVDVKLVPKPNKSASMSAAPKVNVLWRNKKNRQYRIYIKLGGPEKNGLQVQQLSHELLLGVLGHELGHIADYHQKTRWQLICMGIQQMSKKYVAQMERQTDKIAIEHGLGNYLLQFREYVLQLEHMPKFKQRTIKNYLTPNEIKALLQEQSKSN